MESIYLDHNATTPLDPEVREELVAALETFGNPSSIHAHGQASRGLLDKARTRVARLVGARPDEVLFTSGGTEADNLAVLGTVSNRVKEKRNGVVTTSIEHQAVLNPCRVLSYRHAPLTVLPVNPDGLLRLDVLEKALTDTTLLVSVMLANNDTGVIQPVEAVTQKAHARGILVHCDAVQAAGKIPVDRNALDVDLLTISSHKIYGPKGVGALVLRQGTRLDPIVFGGHQEKAVRPGTENLPGIAAFGKACELAARRLEEDAKKLAALRDAFEASVLAAIPGVTVNGAKAPRVPNTSNLSFEGIDGESLAINLDLMGVSVSTGAACAAADREPSHVLLAMGRSRIEATRVLRVSFGRSNTPDQVPEIVERMRRVVESIRKTRS